MQRMCIVGLVVILLILAGCAGQNTTQSDTNTNSDNIVAPTPSSDDVGTVSGQVLNLSEGETEPRPITTFSFYLGETIMSDTGVEALTGLSKNTAPEAKPDEQGNFIFVDVPTGRYGLWLDTPRGPINLRQPSGENLIVEITGGNTVELGELLYSELEGF